MALNKTLIKKNILQTINFSVIFLVVYLIIVPFYPVLSDVMSFSFSSAQKAEIMNHFPDNPDKQINNMQPSVSVQAKVETYNSGQNIKKLDENRLIIKKIGVDAPIIVTNSEKEGLAKGVWLYPNGKKPNEPGNVIISGHRYKYLPPNSVTFYSLDKIGKGDEIIVTWNKDKYIYKVNQTKIVEPNDRTVVVQTDQNIITLITCHPLFTSKQRLIVIGELKAIQLLDSDEDKLADIDEAKYGTNQKNPDTDGDGYLDGIEVTNGYDPKGSGRMK